jgi:hypothetical protein
MDGIGPQGQAEPQAKIHNRRRLAANVDYPAHIRRGSRDFDNLSDFQYFANPGNVDCKQLVSQFEGHVLAGFADHKGLFHYAS